MNAAPGKSAPSLLIVDDSPANLQLLVGVLRDRGFRVRPVPSGELALQAARAEPPGLILLDINMPAMSGYEVCERLQADPVLKAVPVIFISALNGAIDKVRAFGVGGVDYVTKPFQFEEVEARVRTHLELARLRQELEQDKIRLEEKVAQRTQELAAAHARLAILDQAKSDFLHLISHEVRTPLNGILGTAEMLLLEHERDPATAEFASLYETSRRRLMTLLDDALLLTQIGVAPAGGAPTQCDLADALTQARAAAGPLAQARGVELAVVPPELGRVQGASENLVRALQSLLETAVKFARTGTRIRVTQVGAPGDCWLFIEADGHAVPEGLLPHFFDLLAVSEPIAEVDDLGLAPALAERIVTLYGGTVSVNNLPSPGLRLTLRLKTLEANPARTTPTA